VGNLLFKSVALAHWDLREITFAEVLKFGHFMYPNTLVGATSCHLALPLTLDKAVVLRAGGAGFRRTQAGRADGTVRPGR